MGSFDSAMLTRQFTQRSIPEKTEIGHGKRLTLFREGKPLERTQLSLMIHPRTLFEKRSTVSTGKGGKSTTNARNVSLKLLPHQQADATG